MEQLNKNNFNSEVEKGAFVVDFWAPWCGPCMHLAPVFEELSKEYKNVKFGKVNIDEEQELASVFQVRSIPCIIIFKNGKVIGKVVGAMKKDALKSNIDNLLK
jgi:thioredoxin 1